MALSSSVFVVMHKEQCTVFARVAITQFPREARSCNDYNYILSLLLFLQSLLRVSITIFVTVVGELVRLHE